MTLRTVARPATGTRIAAPGNRMACHTTPDSPGPRTPSGIRPGTHGTPDRVTGSAGCGRRTGPVARGCGHGRGRCCDVLRRSGLPNQPGSPVPGMARA